MKNKIIIAMVSLFIIIGSIGIYFVISIYNEAVIVTLKDNLDVIYNEEVSNLSFIKEVKNGTIISSDEVIDTSMIGSKEIKIELENKLGRKQFYTFMVNVIDVTSPVINYKDSIVVTEGDSVNLLKDVKAIDDVDGEVEVKVEGEYNLNKAGTYKLLYVAQDSSGNLDKKEFKLIVNKKVISNSNSGDRTFTTSKGFTGVIKDGITYIDGILIANKTYGLPSSYGKGLTTTTSDAFNNMKNDASKDGINISIISGFRSYSSQKSIYNNYVSRDGKAKADRYSARAGHSEHQTGLAVDINSLYTSFENTNEGRWLNNNAYKYGFILRYPKDGEEITGYMFEPWHYRYVGVQLATKLYNNGNWITLEEYFGITSKYQ